MTLNPYMPSQEQIHRVSQKVGRWGGVDSVEPGFDLKKKSFSWRRVNHQIIVPESPPKSMDGWVEAFPFNSISVISGWWKGEHERICAMKHCFGSERISPLAGFEPVNLWSQVGSANCPATQTRQTQDKKILDPPLQVFHNRDLGKQYRPRSDAAEGSV